MENFMPTIDLGAVGVVLSPASNGLAAAAREVEALGYSALWLTGGPLQSLDQVREVVEATSRIRVATGILAVDRFPAADATALYSDLEASHPGRFVVGLGGAHGPRPLRTLAEYVDALGDAVPPTARVFAALGPKMLAFAREHGSAAYPGLVIPGYTKQARAALGDDTTLAVSQLAVLDTDPGRARAAARGPVGFLGSLPAYQASFRRMGFTEEEITTLADRLVDELVPHGDVATIAAAVAAQSAAGADHVAVSLVAEGADVPLDSLRALAKALLD
jgi:probable F420-dependent oxidoreductase